MPLVYHIPGSGFSPVRRGQYYCSILRGQGFAALTAEQRARAGPLPAPGAVLHARDQAPVLGQHTDEVLRDVLALSHAAITHLRDAGVLE